jgi:hypothetical protein
MATAAGGSKGGVVAEQRMQIADDLWIEWIDLNALREQDINAQQMQPRQMDRLTENIRLRGQVESLPYCCQETDGGPIAIISGHHRARAARAAGLTRIPVIIDRQPMTKSRITAKQIAHNELVGESDRDILAQMVASLESVDDMLLSGLDENWLPTPGDDGTELLIPHAEFDWRLATLLFLPGQLDRLNELADLCSGSDLVGVAQAGQFDDFSKAMVAFARVRNVKNLAVVVDVLTQIALREVDQIKAAAIAAATP